MQSPEQRIWSTQIMPVYISLSFIEIYEKGRIPAYHCLYTLFKEEIIFFKFMSMLIVCIFKCTCIYVYIYIHICIYTHIFVQESHFNQIVGHYLCRGRDFTCMEQRGSGVGHTDSKELNNVEYFKFSLTSY